MQQELPTAPPIQCLLYQRQTVGSRRTHKLGYVGFVSSIILILLTTCYIVYRSFSRSSATVRSLWSRMVRRYGYSNGKLTGKREPVIRSGGYIMRHVLALLTCTLVHQGPNGYPRLATFLDSDDNFMIYRRFGFLQSRLLLEKQDSLRLLEQELDFLDIEETQGDGNEYNLCSRDPDDEDLAFRRKELMKKIDETFRDYGR
jgi:hypothetical protein